MSSEPSRDARGESRGETSGSGDVTGRFSQVVEVRGHIIDSMVLPRILDQLLDLGVDFDIQELTVGRSRTSPSYARIEVLAATPERLDAAIQAVQASGATPLVVEDVELRPSPRDGVVPEGFYSTTNLRTWIRHRGGWIPVAYPEMDCAVVVEDDGAETVPIADVRAGQTVVVGHRGVRVEPLERPRGPEPLFGFMGSAVSSEKPKARAIQEAARWMREARAAGGKIVVVAGPAVIHSGCRDDLCRLIDAGYVDYLFAGNALAVHDVEAALYGTSLGMPLAGGPEPESGHQHHLRAINRIRAEGSIRAAVESGVLREGVMYTCVRRGVDFVLAGSIRDDGPLPDVVTDVIVAQREMRARIRQGVQVALMLSTMLHSIAVGNLLPASVHTICVDVNPAVLTKLSDRGSFQTIGLVMDVGGFLRELLDDLTAPGAFADPAQRQRRRP